MITEQIIRIDQIPIRVLRTGSSEKTIVFVHGNSCNAGMWQSQLSDPVLTSNYSLVSFDLPGCGRSGKIANYSMQHLASFIPAVVENLGIKQYLLVGISYGTCLIGEAAPHLPGCTGVLLISANLVSNELSPAAWLIAFPEAVAMASEAVDNETLLGFAKMLATNPNSPVVAEYIDSYKNTDPAFRLAIGRTMVESSWTDEVKNLLAMQVPVGIVFGGQEKMIRTSYLDHFPNLWRANVFIIPDAAHFVNIEQREVFNRLLLDFATDASK